LQADYSVELGGDDETLELPWAAPEGGPSYYDLKCHPEKLDSIEEASRVPELRAFLATVNSPTSILESAKCDVWSTTELNPEEEIFGAAWKFASYVDLIFSNDDDRASFPAHEEFLRQLTAVLKRAPEIPGSAEFLLRRCFWHCGETTREGFYVTFYLFGYGPDEMKARQQWSIALTLTLNAITQRSRRM
jgi:hypothetical protein